MNKEPKNASILELKSIIDTLFFTVFLVRKKKYIFQGFGFLGPSDFENAMNYVWYLYGMGMTDQTASKKLCGTTTKSQRIELKHQALILIMKRASPSLRNFLTELK